MNGFILLDKKLLHWEHYKHPNELRVFLHLLLNANYEPKRWKGQEIKRGQLVTSNAKLAHDLNMSVSTVRTSIRNLELTNEIARMSTNKYTLIIICNYELYQDKYKSDRHTDRHKNGSKSDIQIDIQNDYNIKKYKRNRQQGAVLKAPVDVKLISEAIQYYGQVLSADPLIEKTITQMRNENWLYAGQVLNSRNYMDYVRDFLTTNKTVQ